MLEYNTTNVTVTSMTHTHNVDFESINKESDHSENDPVMKGGSVPSPNDKNEAQKHSTVKTSVLNTRSGKVRVLNSTGKYITIPAAVYYKNY